METQQAGIIIPIYHHSLTEDELFSLQRCIEILGRHPIIIIHPDGLNMESLKAAYPTLLFEPFSPAFFNGRTGYNRLMMSKALYERFAGYEYILIHQLDVFVFEDHLAQWCNRKYDYIGAPWLGKAKHQSLWYRKIFVPLRNLFHRMQGKPCKLENRNIVGNGGFSLRKVSSHLRVLSAHPKKADLYAEHSLYSRYFEDKFWSIEAPGLDNRFSIPHWKEALSFAFDKYPDLCYKKNGRQLPFGVHGFNKRKTRRFWRPILKPYKELLSNTFPDNERSCPQ